MSQHSRDSAVAACLVAPAAVNDTWVDFPLYQVLKDHQASIAEDPGAPDP